MTQYTNLAADIRWVGTLSSEILTDIVMQRSENIVTITAVKEIHDIESISLLFLYDDTTVRWTDGTVSSMFDTVVAPAWDWAVSVLLMLGQKTLQQWDDIVQLRVTWEASDLILADAVVLFDDWLAEPLSITLP